MSVSSVGSSLSFSPSFAAPTSRAGGAGGRPGEAQGEVQGKAQGNAQGLSEADLRRVEQLKQRDREVRAHEMAHVAAGAGVVTSGASYSFETGPDGRRYAVGGEVGINVSPGRTPEETLSRAEKIRAAALAPADPSGQDRQIAARAASMAAEARVELATRSRDEDAAGPAQAYRVAESGGRAPATGSALDTYA
ncbi:MAG TPA: putative metalloprotease CJM1_0395 family protein [Zoogloea sp.]|nr:putative metalloprotease CJM1_0395 family protein [Zoogloea sp.]